MSNKNASNRKVGNEPSILHFFSKAAPKRTKTSSKSITDEPIMSSSAMTPLPSSATPFNPNLPPSSSAATPASVSSEESLDSPGLGEVTIESSSSSQQQHVKLMSSSATPKITTLNGDNNTPQTPPTPPPTHELENDDVETPPSPDSQVSSTPCTPPTPESEQLLVMNRNRKRRQPQDVMAADDNMEGDTLQSLLDKHENDDCGEKGYELQRQSSIDGVSAFHNKSSTASTTTTTSVSSSITFTSNKVNKQRIMNNSRRSFKSSATPKQPIQKKKKSNQQQQQLFLDFGQSSFGKRTVCSICGMMRVHGVTEDDVQHDKICKDFKEGVTCLGWKNERKVEEYGGGTTTTKLNDRILEVRAGDSLQHRKKVLEVKRIVDGELGFAIVGRQGDGDDVEVEADPLNGLTSYLYVSNKRIVGLLLVKRIQRAYQVVVPKSTNTNDKKANDESSSSFSISRSLKPTRALLGIHQIWVHSSHRNKGIASKMVTAARDHLIFGMMVPLELIAFSSPTMEGLRFAQTYLDVERPLVYDIN
eukprot:scaffold5399_cov147-Skeletonema_menzelii.AAC.6